MDDETPVRSVGPVCIPCTPPANLHEACQGCRGCGCLKSAQRQAAAGPKLPDPQTYRGAPDA